jgi:hypothetical protein
MRKFVAQVVQVRHAGGHTVGAIVDRELCSLAEVPVPSRVEIEVQGGPEEPCMMCRYTAANEFCGDTWHESFSDAVSQAEYEYGLSESDFVEGVDPP